ncbi:TRAP transporter large permease [Leisingera daeponensis]|uniref:TRAP transporter large permease n=1 Tax=Leisingera daeponensis TaxID=405746 RepID=UPI001C980CCB|nr:TRAP transporter large permease [Leisingera daeponensis]MBY6059593.1 TRAP transporter large permease [Leisingera daeponensis]
MWGTLTGGLLMLALSGTLLGCVLGGTGLLLLHFFAGGAAVMAAETLWNDFTKYTLSSVLIFILVGDLFFASGLSRRSYSALAPLFQRIPGKLLHTNVAACILFGAVSGTSTATAAAVGAAAYPELRGRNYNRRAVLGSLAGAGTLGLLIPPSIALILYGAMQEVSIARLFLAGVVPGLLLGFAFMVFIAIVALLKPETTPHEGPKPSLGEILRNLVQIWPLVALMASILGPLYAGLAAPTEAAGFGVVFTLALGFTVGTLNWNLLVETVLSTMLKFGAIIFVVAGAVILKQTIGILGVPRQALDFLFGFNLGKYEAMLAVVLFYLILGCLFDGISLLLLSTPFVAPLLVGYGFDPIWIGVLITVLIEIGMITPPVGPNLFILSSITKGEAGIGEIARATIPYWLILIGGVAMLALVPGLALWLPKLVMG